ncbi:MAG: outer membrane protein assembly factor BamB, partial [Thalassolituus oleivorans]
TATGDVVWITQLSSEAVSPASTDDARVFVQTVDGRTSAFERADGKQAWSYQTAAPVLTVRGTGAPVVLEQLVVTGFATGKVVALDKALGIPRWNVRLASPDGRSELERLVDVDGAPIWDNGILYAAAYHGKIAAISQMGETIWEEDGSSYTSPELALGSLYLTLEDDSIQSYDMVNGAKAWKQTALTGREVGQVTAIGTQLAVADGEGYVHTMSQVDGHITGRILLRPRPIHMSFPNQGEATNWRALRGKDFGIRSTLVATDAGLLVYTNTGELLLLNVES